MFFGSAMTNFGVQPFLENTCSLLRLRNLENAGRFDFPGRSILLRFRFQNPGEYGSQASRQSRIHAHLLRHFRKGRKRPSPPERQDAPPVPAAAVPCHGKTDRRKAYPGDIIGILIQANLVWEIQSVRRSILSHSLISLYSRRNSLPGFPRKAA